MPKQRNEIISYNRDIGYDMQISYDTSNRTEYVGLASPGALTSEESWQIYRLEYDPTSGGVSKRRYANSNDKFDKEWDERASYDYVDIT